MTAQELQTAGDTAAAAGDEVRAQQCYKRAANAFSTAGDVEAGIRAGLLVVDSLLREAKANAGLAWAAGHVISHIEDGARPWIRKYVSEAVHHAVLAKRDEVNNEKERFRQRLAESPPTVTVAELRKLGDAVGGAFMAGGYCELDLGLKAGVERKTTVGRDGQLVSLVDGQDE